MRGTNVYTRINAVRGLVVRRFLYRSMCVYARAYLPGVRGRGWMEEVPGARTVLPHPHRSSCECVLFYFINDSHRV